MAKRQRDYRAEYQRRIQRAREKAEREGVPLDLSKARGHGSRQEERQRTRERASGRFSERTLERLHRKMLNTDHAMERILGGQDDGLTVAQIERLIELQNEAHEMYRRGEDIEQVRAQAFKAAALAEEYGATDSGWHFYH